MMALAELQLGEPIQDQQAAIDARNWIVNMLLNSWAHRQKEGFELDSLTSDDLATLMAREEKGLLHGGLHSMFHSRNSPRQRPPSNHAAAIALARSSLAAFHSSFRNLQTWHLSE